MTDRRRHLRGHEPYMDAWHRPASVARFIDRQRARWITMIDIDCCEYCHLCGEPVALIETKLVWATWKAATVTAKLADRAGLPAYLVEYETYGPSLPCGVCGRPTGVDGDDIIRFIVHGITDVEAPGELEPAEYARWLWALRFQHWSAACPNPRAAQMKEEAA